MSTILVSGGAPRRTLALVMAALLSCTTTGAHPDDAVPAAPVSSTKPLRSLVKFEPQDGKVLHMAGGTAGGQEQADEEYAQALGAHLTPMADAVFISLPGTRPFNHVLRSLNRPLAELKRSGKAMNLTLDFSMRGTDGFGTAGDKTFAETSEYDAMAKDLIRMIRESGVPTFLRVGGEVNGEWQGNHPYVLPKAYRKLVEMFRAGGADNVAYVWCVEGHGDSAIEERDARGNYKWFPGDDVIDWYGLDVFPVQHFDKKSAERSRRQGRAAAAGATAVADRLLALARRNGKPVLIGETSPIYTEVPPGPEDADGAGAHRVWRTWFVPFVRFLDAHPEIKGVCMLSVDWRRTSEWSHWGDTRIQSNPRLVKLWREELEKDRWVHLAEWSARAEW